MSTVPSLSSTPSSTGPAPARGIARSLSAVDRLAGAASPPVDRTDSVELSSEALSRAGESRPIRSDLVSSVRARLAAGTYNEDAKLTIVADRLARLLG